MHTTPRPKETLEMETESGKRTRESSEFVTAKKGKQMINQKKKADKQTKKQLIISCQPHSPLVRANPP